MRASVCIGSIYSATALLAVALDVMLPGMCCLDNIIRDSLQPDALT